MSKKNILFFILIAFKDIFRPKIVALMLLPFFISALFWGLITYFSWGFFTSLGFAFFESSLVQYFLDLMKNIITFDALPFVWITRLFFVGAVIIPLSLISALTITSILLVPVIVEEIRQNDFPTIIKKSQSLFKGSTTSLSLSAKYFFSWIGTLPLWIIIPGGSLIIPFLLLSWFNSRLFSWEILIELMTVNEAKDFVKIHSTNLWILGLITSVLYFIPVINIIAPVITAASFSRYALAETQKTQSLIN
jgi:CysZ protein